MGGGASWNSSNSLYFSRYNSRVGQDDYAVVNLMARYRLTDHLSTTLNLNNLLDEKYYAGFSGSYGHYGLPRNLVMNVRYDFRVQTSLIEAWRGRAAQGGAAAVSCRTR
ncbi:hypothetical protein [Pseudomonas citronellolis]|uniref:hypothetical protein n=1 Tax=Pseudomonas citronellolis TaxID=53408 RepID=UPI002D1E3F9B|nr:hypothetical protein [Pseudomonas citronellolis]